MNVYAQYPSVWKENVVFVCEESLWSVSIDGAAPHRITGTMKDICTPVHSPDGEHIAFSAHGEVYCFTPGKEMLPRRLTFMDTSIKVIGWHEKEGILVLSPHEHPFGLNSVYGLSMEEPGNGLTKVSISPCEFLSYGPQKGCVLQQGGQKYISWKRYQGGTAGKLWIDEKGNGEFSPLLPEKTHNLLRPFWIKDRIYFLSDFQGRGNIYSCTPHGDDIKRHTNHEDFYPHQNTFHENNMVYSAGGRLYVLHLDSGTCSPMALPLFTKSVSFARVKKDPKKNLSSYSLSPNGHSLALTTRGRLFQLSPWKGPAMQRGKANGVRYRLVSWLWEKNTFLVVCDEGTQEILEKYTGTDDYLSPPQQYTEKDFGITWGRIISIYPSPRDDALVLVNHHYELFYIHLSTLEGRFLGKSPKGPIQGLHWSPCGTWVVYAALTGSHCTELVLVNIPEKTSHTVFPAQYRCFSPVFDPDGKYIYFLSSCVFHPQWEDMRFQLFFEKSVKMFALLLQKDLLSPFTKPLVEDDKKEEEDEKKDKDKGEDKGEDTEKNSEKTSEKTPPKPLVIDMEDIHHRVVEFPLKPKEYTTIFPLKNQVIYSITEGEHQALYSYDLSTLKEDAVLSHADSWRFSLDGQWMTYEENKKLRTVKAGIKPDDSPDDSFREGGWLQWNRVPLLVSPKEEWLHMFREAWRLQKDLFWISSMGNIDWEEVYRRYEPCVHRISCFSELLEIIDDMQGELGTSHAYILGRKKPSSSGGSFGARFSFHAKSGAYVVDQVVHGDMWKKSPLQAPGVVLKKGDMIWAIAGQPVTAMISPQEMIFPHAHQVVPCVVSTADNPQEKRTVYVIPYTFSQEKKNRYRGWVKRNQELVAEYTHGRAGYVHIPDMGEEGFGEFFRSYLQEFEKEGLIVDIRFNGGGNVSALILDYLKRKRLGYDYSRNQGILPYPSESPRGPMVALINEYAGSDGDIFAYSFQKMGLGPLVGKRTWGGVVGIWPRYSLLDGTYTTQPEYSFWFHDVGWTVENHGVSPDIDVSIAPQDYKNGQDPQLLRGCEELIRLMDSTKKDRDTEETPPVFPTLSPPNLPPLE